MQGTQVRLLSLLLALALVPAVPTSSFKDPCIIYGQVKNQNEQPISGANITVIENQTGQKRNFSCDENGKFSVTLDNYEVGDIIHIVATDGNNTGEVFFKLNNSDVHRVDVVISQPAINRELPFLALSAILAAGGLLYFLLKKAKREK